MEGEEHNIDNEEIVAFYHSQETLLCLLERLLTTMEFSMIWKQKQKHEDWIELLTRITCLTLFTHEVAYDSQNMTLL